MVLIILATSEQGKKAKNLSLCVLLKKGRTFSIIFLSLLKGCQIAQSLQHWTFTQKGPGFWYWPAHLVMAWDAIYLALYQQIQMLNVGLRRRRIRSPILSAHCGPNRLMPNIQCRINKKKKSLLQYLSKSIENFVRSPQIIRL